MNNPFTLEGKTILVTGASSGIGRAIAVECSKMGATVIATARNEERLKETLELMGGGSHNYIVADLNNDEDIAALVGNLPKLDGVALCSGIGFTLPIAFAGRDKFDKVFQTNFFSPIEACRLLLKKKIIKNAASVVIIASIGGTRLFENGNSVYGASKAAIESMMHYCAREYAPKKIRFNCISPGMVETPLIHAGLEFTDEQLAKDMEKYPLKRYGQPEDVAYGAIYLLSDASSWVTGHSLVIDGGMTL